MRHIKLNRLEVTKDGKLKLQPAGDLLLNIHLIASVYITQIGEEETTVVVMSGGQVYYVSETMYTILALLT